MALLTDPQTGAVADDGTGPPPPADPLAMPGVAPVVNAAGAGGAPPGGSTIQIPEGGSLFPAPAAREVKTPVASGAELANQKVLGQAQDAEIKASGQVGDVERKEAEATANQATDRAAIMEANRARQEQAEADYEAKVAARNQEERELTSKAARDGIAAGEAKAKFWSGNPVGQGLAIIVQSVAAGEQARMGRDGMSPAERFLITRINDYEKMMVSKWEASKEARDLKLKDRPAWEAARAKEIVKSANRSQYDLDISDAAWDRVIKGYGPAKAEALTAEKQAAKAKADALIEQKRTEGLRSEITVRTPQPGAADKRGFAAREDIESVVGAQADIDALEKLKRDAVENPEDFQHVVESKNKFAEYERKRDIASKMPLGIGNAMVGIASLENSDLSKTSPDQLLDTKRFKKSPDIYGGIESANAAKARTYGGVIQEGDRKAAEAASALSSRGPKEYAQYLDTLINIRRKQLDGMVGAKKGLGSFASPSGPAASSGVRVLDAEKNDAVTEATIRGSAAGPTDAELAQELKRSVKAKDGRAAKITQEIARRRRAREGK